MKAVRYLGPGQPFRLEEVNRHKPRAGEVLVRVTAFGMCHTELHFKSGLLDLGVAPVTMGHEVVGKIEVVGEGVSVDRVDERVIVYYYLGLGCLECAYWRVGNEHLCPNLRARHVLNTFVFEPIQWRSTSVILLSHLPNSLLKNPLPRSAYSLTESLRLPLGAG